jgi:hypothetical protein
MMISEDHGTSDTKSSKMWNELISPFVVDVTDFAIIEFAPLLVSHREVMHIAGG